MLGRNNYEELMRKNADHQQRFAIRRVGLVTASVLVGLAFAGGHAVSADELDNATAPAATTTVTTTNTATTTNQDENKLTTKAEATPATSTTADKDQVTPAEEVKPEETVTASTQAEPAQPQTPATQPTESSAKQDQPATAKPTTPAPVRKVAAAPAPTAPTTQDQFSLADWDYTVNEQDKTVQLIEYRGNDTKIRIAGRVETGDYQGYAVTVDNLGGKIKSGGNDTFWGSDSNKIEKITEIAIVAAADGTKVKYTGDHFRVEGPKYIVKLDLSGIDTSDVTSMKYAFTGLSIKEINLSGFDTHNVTDMYAMFWYCNDLESADLSSFDTSKVEHMGRMFAGCLRFQTLDLSNFNTSKVKKMQCMFESCYNLQSLNISGFDTSNVTDMNSMFGLCKKIQTLDLSNFDTGNVENMNMMFENCNNLRSLDLSNFDTQNVKDMGGMFEYCYNLQSLNVGSFDTHNVTDMGFMFSECYRLQAIDLSNFNTANVTTMHGMFEDCTDLRSLDLSNFNTSKVRDMGLMFGGFDTTLNLEALDISNFDLSKVKNAWGILDNVPKLRLVNMANVTMDKLSNEAKEKLQNALNERTGAVAIVAHPDVFALLKSDDSGTVIGPHFNAGGEFADKTVGKFTDGEITKNLVKSQNIDPGDVYAVLPHADQLDIANFTKPKRNSYQFVDWDKGTPENDIRRLHLDRMGLYPLDFETVDYKAVYADNLTIQEVTTGVNEMPDANQALSDTFKSENQVKEIIWNDPQTIDTSLNAVGKDPVAYKATITFEDGGSRVVDVPVRVIDNRTNADKYAPNVKDEVTVKKGDQIDPETLVTNKDELPQGTTITWENTPDTSQPGQTTGTLVITYPDKSQAEFTIKITVIDVIPWTPIVPGHKPETKDDNSTVTPAKETDRKQEIASVTSGKGTANSSKAVKTDKQTLPQTGDEAPANAGLIGAVLASLGLLGLGVTQRRKHN